MNHNPYQDWLFEDRGELSTAEAKALSTHLAECEQCRQQAAALRHLEHALHAQTMTAPATGFVQRWQARLQEERRRAHRMQTRLALGISLSALVTVLGALALLLWPYLGSVEVAFWGYTYQVMSFYYLFEGLGQFLSSLLAATVSVIPLFGWMLAIGMVFELGVLWVVSYRLLTNPRRLENT